MKVRTYLLPAIIGLFGGFASASHADVIKIAHIDPFSGPAAALNANSAHTMEMIFDIANREHWAGPHTFQVVDFDNKNNAQESLLQLKNVQDQGIKYVLQGLSSSIGLGIMDAVNRYNERNPGQEMLFLNSTGAATEMTNEKCSFWHFRFDSNQDMKIEGLTSAMAKDKSIKKVYQINVNYAVGQLTSSLTREMLKRKRPDIEIVGDDLHPFLQVKDFSPYVAKIKASGADAIVTSNWGGDLTLLLRAAKDSGLKVPFWTINASTTGSPTAMAAAGAENVKVIYYWNPNDDQAAAKPMVEPFRAKYDDDFVQVPYYNLIKLLATAVKEANSTAPVNVARRLEGMKVKGLNGEVEMRAADHQILQPLFIANWTKADGKEVRYDLEKTGWGWKTAERVATSVTTLPTTCQMKRP